MGLLNCILWDLQTNSLFNFHLPVSMQTTYRYNCKLPPPKKPKQLVKKIQNRKLNKALPVMFELKTNCLLISWGVNKFIILKYFPLITCKMTIPG